jgi:hypothetical protein
LPFIQDASAAALVFLDGGDQFGQIFEATGLIIH